MNIFCNAVAALLAAVSLKGHDMWGKEYCHAAHWFLLEYDVYRFGVFSNLQPTTALLQLTGKLYQGSQTAR